MIIETNQDMDFLVTENALFRIEHCYSCTILGYLIVSPKLTVTAVHELPQAFQAGLGVSLALASRLVHEVINPVKVYCAQFGEEGQQLHFHIFPRTMAMSNEFLKVHPEQKDLIHGPVLLDWARTRYQASKEKVWSVVSTVINDMRDHNTIRLF